MIATVFCLGRDEVRAMRIVDELRAAGFCEEKISILVPEAAIIGGLTPQRSSHQREHSGVLQGFPQVTILSLPEVGRVIGAGPLMRDLMPEIVRKTGTGFAGVLSNVGLPADRADYYQQNLARGKVLIAVSVCCLDDATRLEAVFNRAGAEDILVRAETSSEAPGCGPGQIRHAA